MATPCWIRSIPRSWSPYRSRSYRSPLISLFLRVHQIGDLPSPVIPPAHAGDLAVAHFVAGSTNGMSSDFVNMVHPVNLAALVTHTLGDPLSQNIIQVKDENVASLATLAEFLQGENLPRPPPTPSTTLPTPTR
eukprot:TRINITY_DN5994_c0_g1_i1.p2 TRINITY_DN5994_c0_g1~~TRINITY_DN5994_c0_g1_i1.p2  ORF type:complete len:134 (+),score=16.10 TRINITY_DN5994_c0_g1_i1:170-571(+)